MRVNDLLLAFEQSGVMGAGSLGRAARILETMLNDKDCIRLLGQAGALVPGGMKNILIDMLATKKFHVFVTTGATLTHDLAEALGNKHYQGSPYADDAELNKQGYDRMYDSLMPNKVYEDIEKFLLSFSSELENPMDQETFLRILGKHAPKNSILRTCYDNKIHLYCPGIADSGIGLMIWGLQQKGKKINVETFSHLQSMIDLCWTAKKTGVFYLGGGLPKNHIQQALQFSKGATYGIQVTTDRAEFGGSSGAPLKEGISWGKLKPNANFTDVICDATIALPLLWGALKDRM